MMVDFQDLALKLLSQRGGVSKKTISDQTVFVEKMIEMLNEDIKSFSLEKVREALPGNCWLKLYLSAIPLIESYIENEQINISYNS